MLSASLVPPSPPAASSGGLPTSQGTFDATLVKGEFNQYWYSQNTIQHLVDEVRHHATCCAFLSTPSLFFALDARPGGVGDEACLTEREEEQLMQLRRNSRIFEYDAQWKDDPCYVHYDFHKPEQVPVQYMGAFDYVVADPPFITEDVWACYVATARLLLKEGGKLLFTTVLENHIMLENLLDRPLFIATFYPLVEHLTYQYVCFLSYEPTCLHQPNKELPGMDPKMVAAVRMANDLRSSEKEFALQMATRKREGEQRLPTAAFERDNELAHDPLAKMRAEEERRALDWETIPIEKMEWGYIPEGLTMYPDGNTPPPSMQPSTEGGAVGAAKAGSNADGSAAGRESYGAVYDACFRLRSNLETFKNAIDAMQRHMDGQMKLRHQRVKLHRDVMALREAQRQPLSTDAPEPAVKEVKEEATIAILEEQIASASAAIDTNERERTQRLDEMARMAREIEAQEQELLTLGTQGGPQSPTSPTAADGDTAAVPAPSPSPPSSVPLPHIPYTATMSECIAAYRTVEAKKIPLQELAADATGRFKFPLFARMKELLQRMKELKRR